MSGINTGIFLTEEEREEVNSFLARSQSITFVTAPQYVQLPDKLFEYIKSIVCDRGLFIEEYKDGYFTMDIMSGEVIWVPA